MTTNANNRPEGNRLTTEVREGHAFLAKGRAESRERGRPRPQQRVLQSLMRTLGSVSGLFLT